MRNRNLNFWLLRIILKTKKRCKCYAATPTTSTRLCTSRKRATWCLAGAMTTLPRCGRSRSVSPLSTSPLPSCPWRGTSKILARLAFRWPAQFLYWIWRYWLGKSREWSPCSTPPPWCQSSQLIAAPHLSSPPPGKFPKNYDTKYAHMKTNGLQVSFQLSPPGCCSFYGSCPVRPLQTLSSNRTQSGSQRRS